MKAIDKSKLFNNIADYFAFSVPVLIFIGCAMGVMQVWDVLIVDDDVAANIYKTIVLIILIACVISATCMCFSIHYKRKHNDEE